MGELLNDLQFDILDALYFVEPFEKIFEEVQTSRPILIDELRTMIDRGWIQVMEFDKDQGDYFRSAIFDTDNLEAYYFLATKAGLLKHNGH